MKILIFIPARGGSKGIPGKNLIDLNGKPLIEYTLNTVKKLMSNSKFDFYPFISSDDDKILKYCTEKGFNSDYKRPKSISGDKSILIDAIWDALNWLLTNKNIAPDAVLLLQPTSPIRQKKDILKAINRVKDNNNFSLVSVTKMREHPYECVKINNNSWSYLSEINHQILGRQDYEENFFFIDGSFYFASTEFLRKNNSFIVKNKTEFHIVNQLLAIDIDTEQDLKIAKAILV